MCTRTDSELGITLFAASTDIHLCICIHPVSSLSWRAHSYSGSPHLPHRGSCMCSVSEPVISMQPEQRLTRTDARAKLSHIHSMAHFQVLLYFQREIGVPRAQQSAAVEDRTPPAFHQPTPRLAAGVSLPVAPSATAYFHHLASFSVHGGQADRSSPVGGSSSAASATDHSAGRGAAQLGRCDHSCPAHPCGCTALATAE